MPKAIIARANTLVNKTAFSRRSLSFSRARLLFQLVCSEVYIFTLGKCQAFWAFGIKKIIFFA